MKYLINRTFLILSLIILLFSCSIPVQYSRSTRDLGTWLDSISKVDGIQIPDTSLWSHSYIDTNKGVSELKSTILKGGKNIYFVSITKVDSIKVFNYRKESR